MAARVLKPFYDLKDGADRRAGDVFEASEGRIREINEALGEPYVEAAAEKPAVKRAAGKTTAKPAAKKPAAKRAPAAKEG